jgi:hypothetical protein
MLAAKHISVWVNDDTKQVMVKPHYVEEPIPYSDGSGSTHCWGRPEDHGYGGHWWDPIGAAFSQWQDMTDDQRVVLMLETAIDLAMQGCSLRDVLREFAKVEEFRALGDKSCPMCRALTRALIGRSAWNQLQ